MTAEDFLLVEKHWYHVAASHAVEFMRRLGRYDESVALGAYLAENEQLIFCNDTTESKEVKDNK